MDGLEHTLDQLRAHDPRTLAVRLRSLRRRLNLLDTAVVDRRAARGAAAYAVVDALAVLAATGGFASDVRGLIGVGGHVHEWGSDYRSCTCGQRPPGDGRKPLVDDTTDEPDPYLGPAPDGRPGRSPAGPAGAAPRTYEPDGVNP